MTDTIIDFARRGPSSTVLKHRVCVYASITGNAEHHILQAPASIEMWLCALHLFTLAHTLATVPTLPTLKRTTMPSTTRSPVTTIEEMDENHGATRRATIASVGLSFQRLGVTPKVAFYGIGQGAPPQTHMTPPYL